MAPIDATPDLLGRQGFAQLVARSIISSAKPGAGVYGLAGGWGVGKTWLAQRVVEAVGDEMTVVHFEPWMITNQEALAREFFLELSKGILPGRDTGADTERREKFWRYAAQVLEVTSTISNSLSVLGVPGAGIVGAIADKSKRPLDIAADALKSRAELPSLRDARNGLIEFLAPLEKPVLMVIDDIDRLPDHDIRTLFRVIKACADFPNVRYLLAFDRETVTHALGAESRNGEGFLDKIVHSIFDLPELTGNQRAWYLEKALSESLPTVPPGPEMDRIGMAFQEVLMPGLHTLRLCDNFSKTATDLLLGLKHPEGIDVDIADFLVLEFLRQRVPNVYAFLRELDSPKAGGSVRLYVLKDETEKETEQAWQEALAAAGDLKVHAQEALDMFRGIGGSRSWNSFFEASESDHRDKRFKSNHWRPVYFGFDAGRASLSSAEFIDLRCHLTSIRRAKQWLDAKLADNNRRGRLLMSLILRVPELTAKQQKTLLFALVVWGEPKPTEATDGVLWVADWPSSTAHLGSALLSALASSNQAAPAVKEALDKHGLVATGEMLVHEMWRQQRKWFDPPWARKEEFDELTKLFCDRVRALIQGKKIWKVANVGELSSAYRQLDASGRAEKWYRSLRAKPAELASWVNTIGVNYLKQDGTTCLAPFEDKKDIAALRSLPMSLLTPKGRNFVRAYLREIDLRRRGEDDL